MIWVVRPISINENCCMRLSDFIGKLMSLLHLTISSSHFWLYVNWLQFWHSPKSLLATFFKIFFYLFPFLIFMGIWKLGGGGKYLCGGRLCHPWFRQGKLICPNPSAIPEYVWVMVQNLVWQWIFKLICQRKK